MKIILCTVFLLSCFFIQVNCKLQITKPEVYYIIRNSILKKIIYDDVTRAKIVINNTKIFYNKLLSKYYEINEKYYSLSENDRTIIETLFSLSY